MCETELQRSTALLHQREAPVNTADHSGTRGRQAPSTGTTAATTKHLPWGPSGLHRLVACQASVFQVQSHGAYSVRKHAERPEGTVSPRAPPAALGARSRGAQEASVQQRCACPQAAEPGTRGQRALKMDTVPCTVPWLVLLLSRLCTEAQTQACGCSALGQSRHLPTESSTSRETLQTLSRTLCAEEWDRGQPG